jgi:hypothetical protein
MEKLKQIRQGDVLLVAVDMARPEDITAKREVILAEGELTGHAHRLKAAEIYEWSVNGQRYVQVAGEMPGELSHEEHDPTPAAIVAPNVTYKVVPQHEWDLSGNGAR